MAKLPWIVPGIRRPNFRFYKLTFTIPREVPGRLFFIFIFLAIFYVYIGGVYDLVEKPLTIGSDANQNPLLIYPGGTDRQFLLEGVVAGILMFIGFGGLYLLDSAAKDPHDTQRAINFIVIGAFITFLALVILNRMIAIKQGK